MLKLIHVLLLLLFMLLQNQSMFLSLNFKNLHMYFILITLVVQSVFSLKIWASVKLPKLVWISANLYKRIV